MANYEATRYDFSGANLIDVEGVNTGIIIPWTNSIAPSGFLECNGQTISRSTFAALFAVIGTTYGSGNGSTTFDLPNLSDSVVLSRSPTKALASTGGANTVTKTGNTSVTAGNTTLTTAQLPAHTHANAGGNTQNSQNQNNSGMGQSAARAPATTYNQPPTGGGGSHNHPVSSSSFTGSAKSVLQPYITLMYVIKT
jgi:microcystin-dependent protein